MGKRSRKIINVKETIRRILNPPDNLGHNEYNAIDHTSNAARQVLHHVKTTHINDLGYGEGLMITRRWGFEFRLGVIRVVLHSFSSHKFGQPDLSVLNNMYTPLTLKGSSTNLGGCMILGATLEMDWTADEEEIEGVSCQNPPYPLQVFYLSPSAVGLLQAPQPIYSARTPDSVFGVEEEEEEAEASQFHSQDGAGRAVFGYTSPDQARIEARNSDGTVRGSYSYLDPRGETVKVQYWDDGTGFHAAGNHLPGFAYVPQPVRDTPEVEEARKIHLHLYEQALNAALASGEGDNVQSDKESVTEGSNPSEEEIEIEGTVYPEHSIGMSSQSLNDHFNAQDDDDAVVIDSPEAQEEISGNYLRNAKTLIKDPNVLPGTANLKEKSSLSPNSGFSYSFRYPVPLYVQVRTVEDDKETTSKETNLNKELSLSQKANLFGAIPVAAVHDAQVSPSQRNSIKNHQTLPLYVEPVIDAN
uniref:Cuticle protein 6 n=1 Tax=Timema shepardi TaxID=629360 RepID=A0A7R9G3H8_TIMSH|nr:unnamed protein product [Timema shepardi]